MPRVRAGWLRPSLPPIDSWAIHLPSARWKMLPWPGKLGFAEQRARRLAQADQLDADDVEQNLVAT